MEGQKLYIIKDEKYYKIGISKNPNKRLRQLQTGHPYPLKLIHIIEEEKYTARQAEALLKNQLFFYKTSTLKEWYNLPDKIIDYLKGCKITKELYKKSKD